MGPRTWCPTCASPLEPADQEVCPNCGATLSADVTKEPTAGPTTAAETAGAAAEPAAAAVESHDQPADVTTELTAAKLADATDATDATAEPHEQPEMSPQQATPRAGGVGAAARLKASAMAASMRTALASAQVGIKRRPLAAGLGGAAIIAVLVFGTVAAFTILPRGSAGPSTPSGSGTASPSA
jgi:membrane-bound lytic murein transglycosylase B